MESLTVKLQPFTLTLENYVWLLAAEKSKEITVLPGWRRWKKKLRSHIEVSERFNKSTDKRGLILAGADRVMRELTNIFKDDPQFAEPIENAMNAVWAKVYSE